MCFSISVLKRYFTTQNKIIVFISEDALKIKTELLKYLIICVIRKCL